MFDDTILCFCKRLGDIALLVEIADLVLRVGVHTLLSVLLLSSLIGQETLQVVFQLIVHFVPLVLDSVGADEREKV